MEIAKILSDKKYINKELEISGWVRFNRLSKQIGFITLFDGSNLEGIQLVYKETIDKKIFELLSKLTNYSALTVIGKLVFNKNKYEIIVSDLKYFAISDSEIAIGKKEHGLEFLRSQAHLRIRTKLFQAIMSIRSFASQYIHLYFLENGFFYINTPIITKNDAEGAGETFFVKIKDNKPFFKNQGTLTVSGQLQEESYTQGLKKTYTFGPTFRAENSNTSRHANEFWMIEPEIAFSNYFDAMKLSESVLKFVVSNILKKCDEQLIFLENYFKANLRKDFNNFLSKEIPKIKYQEAIEILKKAQEKNGIFKADKFEFGIDLSTEHEKYLASNYAKGPIFVYDFPKEASSFYMALNEDKKTSKGFDLLVPKIGELVGGSQREDNYQNLISIIKDKKLELKDLDWYLDLRKFGYAKSAGFGIGFERLVMYLTGVENIRDVLPFPRTPGKLEF